MLLLSVLPRYILNILGELASAGCRVGVGGLVFGGNDMRRNVDRSKEVLILPLTEQSHILNFKVLLDVRAAAVRYIHELKR